MSRDYAEGRIREALRRSGGNMIKARQQVIAWTYEDTKLLHELAKPHLTGIVAHAVGRVSSIMTREEGDESKLSVEDIVRKTTPPVKAAKNKEEKFGLDLLKAIAQGDPAMFGQESFAAPVKSKQASQRHVDTIKSLAARDVKKNKKK